MQRDSKRICKRYRLRQLRLRPSNILSLIEQLPHTCKIRLIRSISVRKKYIRVWIILSWPRDLSKTHWPKGSNLPNHLIQQAGFFLQKCEGKCEGRKFALTLALTTETPINRAFLTKSEGVRAKKEKNFFLEVASKQRDICRRGSWFGCIWAIDSIMEPVCALHCIQNKFSVKRRFKIYMIWWRHSRVSKEHEQTIFEHKNALHLGK